ncbi:MAG: lactate permease [Acidobacteria bacterium]|nr:MAG: lactate permease [Acidobacteriota bacterium]PYT40826.1 MAG: lactate permease [Acidobacteriota bacterium]PYT55199.1 MAG: lactate permease [Acidobacteriota bacterium]
MTWNQNYDPLGHWWLSTLVAALPVVVLLGALAVLRIKAHWAALLGLAASLLIAIGVFKMPAGMGARTAVYGACYGLFPIGWIILNVIFMYDMNCASGRFKILQESLMGITQDRRLQLLLIAFSFGAFFEGAAGFGTPVAVTAAILIGLGFKPLQASGLSLIANTAPVAYGALGTPLIALQTVTGLDLLQLSGMAGRILPFFSVLVPFWLLWAFAGFNGMIEIWPAVLVAGVFFAIPQFLVSNFHGPWLVDVVSAVCSMAAVTVLLLVWHPKKIWGFEGHEADRSARGQHGHSSGEVVKAWTPWVILSVLVFLWGLPSVKAFLDKISIFKIPVSGLHNLILRVPPVVAKNTAEAAVFNFNWLSATGSGILVAAIISGFVMGFGPLQMLRQYGKTLYKVRFSLITIAAMMSIGFMTRYGGLDATMGLAFARTGTFYPFFGTLLGWLGVALTGSDTASNVLFGSLQKISATQVGLSPTLMAAANSCGGVMGKMIDAQSIVVASTATEWYGHEGDILRYVFFHSIALASLVGVLVFLQAYVFPFTKLVIH